MAIDPIELERPIVYDIEECKDEWDVCCTRDKLAAQVGRMMTRESYERVAPAVQLGAGEITKDIWVHGDENEPMLVLLQPEMGGVALHSFSIEDPAKGHLDKWGEEINHNGMGEEILNGLFGDDYAMVKDGDVYERHIFIRGEVDVIEFPRIPHGKRESDSQDN